MRTQSVLRHACVVDSITIGPMFSSLPEPFRPDEPVVSISALNRLARECLEQRFPLMWVSGEISNLTRAASGHVYFSLKDEAAQVRCVMFRHRAQRLPFQIQNGLQIEARVLVSLFEPRGDFQLRIESISRSGQGALFEAFLARKQKLLQAGLLDPERKRPIPTTINAIGLVTSLGAAALRDVVVTLTQLAPRIRIVLYPSLVQGTEAAAMLCQQIRRADQNPALDALLLVRGGGSLEDLWAFNDEELAHAIAGCQHVVIAGIGHETDVTIADLVADIRAATPTAAAQSVARRDQQAVQLLTEFGMRAAAIMRRRWTAAQQRLDLLSQAVKSPRETLALRQLRLEGLTRHLRLSMQGRLQVANARLDRIRAELSALDPTAILGRGYAMVLDTEARLVTDARAVGLGQALTVQLAKGLLDVRVHRAHGEDPAG